MNNTAIFAISNFSSKILSFLMLPVYTRVLTTSEYGLVDLIISMVTLLFPIFSLSISDSALRFCFEKDYPKDIIFSISIIITIFGLVALSIFCGILISTGIVDFDYVFIIIISIPNYLYTLFSMFLRGTGNVVHVGIAGIIASLSMVLLNLTLLLAFHQGIYGYLIAYAGSFFVAAIYLFIAGGLYRYISFSRQLRLHSFRAAKDMLLYGLPLIPNRICWWMNNTANRFILNWSAGAGSVGLYSAGMKIPSILDSVQGIFNQAWLLSAIQEKDTNDSLSYYRKSFRMYSFLLIATCSVILLLMNPIADILFDAGFKEARYPASLLLISSVLGGMVGFSSAIINAYKMNTFLLISVLCGSITTILCSLLLVPILNETGAAVANAFGYALIWLIISVELNRRLGLQLNSWGCSLAVFLIILQVLAQFLLCGIIFWIIQVIILFLILLLYKREIKYIIGLVVYSRKADNDK